MTTSRTGRGLTKYNKTGAFNQMEKRVFEHRVTVANIADK